MPHCDKNISMNIMHELAILPVIGLAPHKRYNCAISYMIYICMVRPSPARRTWLHELHVSSLVLRTTTQHEFYQISPFELATDEREETSTLAGAGEGTP